MSTKEEGKKLLILSLSRHRVMDLEQQNRDLQNGYLTSLFHVLEKRKCIHQHSGRGGAVGKRFIFS